jgi:RNA polymerase sigma-70 factor (ECF subfamily)
MKWNFHMPSYHTFTDDELSELLKSSDEDAFTEIYNRYWQPLLHTAFHILQDKEAVQDIVQNVFISLWMRRSAANIKNLNGYLRQAVRFSVFKAIREIRHDRAFYERLTAATVDIITDDPLLFKEQQQLVQQLIDTMPKDWQEVFLLSRENNMTYKQIAELLGISEKTVEKRISRSLKFLRSVLTTSIFIIFLIMVK